MESTIQSTGFLLATILAVSSLAILVPAADACAAKIDLFVCVDKVVNWGMGTIDPAGLSTSNSDNVQILGSVNDPETGVASFTLHCSVEGKNVATIKFQFVFVEIKHDGSLETVVKDVKLHVSCIHL